MMGPSEATTRADAFCDEDGQVVSLTAELVAPRDLLAAGDSALVNLLMSHGDSVASYGCVGSPVDGGRTALDRALRRSRAVSVRKSRQWLRGYDWATLVPPELVDPIDRRRADGELARVVELANGGLVLVGSEHFDAFDDAALERVFGVVEPVLPRVEPQTPKIYGHEQLPRLVWQAPQDDQ